ncbi:MAG: site-2 protease family protein [Patescibacteria group bacterium]|nr:site-2 protease family protein [Patescibacteria group bacterium]MDD5121061.1 site-2 protease family protein [Patescibacteria group bacterium]MDD5221577.1 site-2 protease family protein [Patescibacteria group bacterium]MDD5396020.1 site-2 protease family protein [Patescibacteria group bacterium]
MTTTGIFISFFVIVVPSAILHEFSHAWMAYYLGDDTAKRAGRLTLNPLPHIDLFGTILLPIVFLLSGIPFIFAYAKPVPYNPYNLRNQRIGPALVGLAGPLSNLLVAVIFGILLRFLPVGSFVALYYIIYINILLAVFNLVPIPPLDGSKVLYALMPDSWMKVKIFLERYGIILVLIFIFFAFQIIQPIISFLYHLIVGSFPQGL